MSCEQHASPDADSLSNSTEHCDTDCTDRYPAEHSPFCGTSLMLLLLRAQWQQRMSSYLALREIAAKRASQSSRRWPRRFHAFHDTTFRRASHHEGRLIRQRGQCRGRQLLGPYYPSQANPLVKACSGASRRSDSIEAASPEIWRLAGGCVLTSSTTTLGCVKKTQKSKKAPGRNAPRKCRCYSSSAAAAAAAAIFKSLFVNLLLWSPFVRVICHHCNSRPRRLADPQTHTHSRHILLIPPCKIRDCLSQRKNGAPLAVKTKSLFRAAGSQRGFLSRNKGHFCWQAQRVS